jgi:hypothetical protein
MEFTFRRANTNPINSWNETLQGSGWYFCFVFPEFKTTKRPGGSETLFFLSLFRLLSPGSLC